jgi:hypothetical protein
VVEFCVEIDCTQPQTQPQKLKQTNQIDRWGRGLRPALEKERREEVGHVVLIAREASFEA